jgi:hypothetical protein
MIRERYNLDMLPLACRSCAIERAVQRLCMSDGTSILPSIPVLSSSGPKIFEELDF